ncbi:hypothetical protein VMCG_07618 [Cytospora schulzeri]|uniref:Cytochrome P450 monooxygenase n=1 Tax=Cytospora schulzeri TaxID=448051 RepID=A0A423VXA1_9PEZI|nr:hypothetical protein VMCG_07618 [Valsa malicola]
MDFKGDAQRLDNPSSFPNIVLVFLFAYLLYRTVYDVCFHPLSKFPGPLWARLTRVPYWIASIKGEQIYFMRRLHAEYGPIVRYSPEELSYTDARAWKDICGTPHLLVTSTSDHARVRRLISPTFSDRYLKQHEPVFRKYVDLLMTRLSEAEGRPVEMTEMFNLATFDIMGDFAFGESLGLLEHNKSSSWLKVLFDSVRVLPFVQMIEYYPLLSKAFKLVEPRRLTEMKASHFRYSADRVDRRLERKPAWLEVDIADVCAVFQEKSDIWSFVLSAGPGDGLTRAEMHVNAAFLISAGSETTGKSTLLSGVLFLLLRDPTHFERLKEEVCEQAVAGTLTFERLSGLKYLNACIQEALRIYPPVPVGVPRVISPDNGGQIVCGQWVPSGTRVCVHQYATYQSPENFKDPELFAPQRWLDEDSTYKEDRRDALQPFSFGPRNCVGQNMAWHEMRLILGILISTFDIELCEESCEWMYQKVYTLWKKKPLMVRLKPRSS